MSQVVGSSHEQRTSKTLPVSLIGLAADWTAEAVMLAAALLDECGNVETAIAMVGRVAALSQDAETAADGAKVESAVEYAWPLN